MIRSDSRTGRAARRATFVALLALACASLPAARAAAQPASCQLGGADLIDHDFGQSYCELCGPGRVRIVVENPFDANDDLDFSQIVVREDLDESGLTYVPGSTVFIGDNVAPPPVVEPVVSGGTDEILTWTLPPAFELEGRNGGSGNKERLIIEFGVERDDSVSEEGLVFADREIEARVDVTPSCSPGDRFSGSTGFSDLPLREPELNIAKSGRNVDAGQASNRYSDPVYGHAGDDVIWRIRIRNDGEADLQDFVFSDSIVPGNFDITHVCDSEADATDIANGNPAPDCVDVGSTQDVPDFDVRAAFGGGANPYIVAPAGGRRFYYFVGRITNSCRDRVNSAYDAEWGCQSEPPVGGIDESSTGVSDDGTGTLRTFSVEDDVEVDVALTGIDTGQPMGATGTVTITIRNESNGTIKGPAGGIRVRSVLPPEYVIDPTFAPQLDVQEAYGNSYPGVVDTLEWVNAQGGTFPDQTSPNAGDYLANDDLEFRLTSSSPHPEFPDQEHMIRNGDVVTITYRTVLIDSSYYDLLANVDVRTEEPGSDPPDTDPAESFAISSDVEVHFEEFCTPGVPHQIDETENDVAEPEDIDVDMVGSELLFILTGTGDPLQLTVNLRNDGGHDAQDYFAYVTFGEAMTVSSVPAGCSLTTNPPAMPNWRLPADLPASGAVYQCDRGTLSPGETEALVFEVVKNTGLSFDDDLTFRADVIGEITLSDGTPLWFPPPVARSDGVTDRANDYTLDALRARVIGYDLLKSQLGICSENVAEAGTPDDEVEIGEECSYHVESGGWFGFQTPGFTYIAVQNIQVVDQNPDGQGYLASTNPLLTSTAAIQGVSLNPPPDPLDEAPFDWTFNTVVPDERISEKDHWFRVDFRTRMLNDPQDDRAPPNEHAAQSSNVLTSTFEAIFLNALSGEEELYELGPSTIGYPREVFRRVDLTVTEPLLTVTKEVCNETLNGPGEMCTQFQPTVDDGDAFDTYVYRITVTNEEDSGGVQRAPAYDVTVTSVTDGSDLLFVDPLTGDGLDNDGDGDADAADLDGEGTITDNVVENGVPARVIASYTHSDDLLRIDPGQSVVLYYRVDPDDDVAPQQQLVSGATAGYDSLEGASGSQSAPLGANGELGGPRRYATDPADPGSQATIEIIPVEVSPKQILETSDTALVPPTEPQPVAIGEEVRFGLETLIPVAQLRQLTIRDELPPGISCAEAPTVDLDAPPYDAAGFVPGGQFVPTCTDAEVMWSFGDQTVTESDRVDRRFEFAIDFVARVDNEIANQDGVQIVNGGTATATTVSYIDEGGGSVVIPFEAATLLVREPQLDLEKSFSVMEVDGADVVRVSVTATNSGTGTAYRPRVLEDLSPVDLSYAGDVQGAVVPQVDLVTFGPERPLFSWPAGFALAPGESVSFSFAVLVDPQVETGDVLPNTVQADWTSLPGSGTALNATGAIGPDGAPDGMRIGALPNAGDALNDYESEASASVEARSPTSTKTDLDPALVPAIGTHKPFEVVVELAEGRTRQLVVADSLQAGTTSYVLADNADFQVSYQFEGIASINGAAPSEAVFVARPVDGTSGVAVWDVGNVVTESEDDLATQLVTPRITIRYSGRIDNNPVTDAGSTLQNEVLATWLDGETGLQDSATAATAPVVAVEPVLTATKTLANVTAGKAAGDPPAFGDTLEYVVSVVNEGDGTAWDLNLVDTIPPELSLDGGFTPTATIDMAPVGGFVATPAGGPGGPLVWGRENGDQSLDLPPAGFLLLTYRTQVTTPILDAATLANSVWIDWTSLQAPSVWERTGDGCPTITPPDDYCLGPVVAEGTAEPIAPPDALRKENTQPTAAVGEAFRYRITVPDTAYPFDLHDVRIQDDLTASAAALRFLSVARISGSQPWTPVNTGSDTDLVIEDPVDGIDIPAGEQVELEITVVLEDVLPPNASGLPFTNTATYVYNWVDDNDASVRPGSDDTTEPMTVVGPDDLRLTKSGPPQMTIGTPGVFTLDLHNVAAGPAWNLRLLDLLSDEADGGTCDVPPASITAGIFDSTGMTLVSGPLDEGTDFVATFRGAPDCELELEMLTPAAVVGPDQRLIVSYELELDLDSQDGAVLTNVAGAVEWFSADGSVPATAGDRRTFTRTVLDGSVGTPDHEDAHEVLVALPRYRFEKTVRNVTTGEDPATAASPGDRLAYRIEVENLADSPIDDFTLRDELDRLNAPPVFAPGSLLLVSAPASADTGNTSPTGGAQGTGLIEVGGLALPGLGDSVVVEFEVDLAPVIADATIVTNQSQLLVDGTAIADSDDPNQNGPADPLVPGDEDPTRVAIASAPALVVEKTSADLSGDPAVLLAGETLRYTITVENAGSADVGDASLRDAVPANTTYVPGSTTLNGAPVPDGAGGLAPLSVGIPIQAPSGTAPGELPANVPPDADNVATLRFDVVVDPDALDGTVIANQAFVSAPGGGIVDQPSDDPDTPLPDDPTRDVVGDLPLLFAAKDVAIQIDGDTMGVVDPNDVLRYTITVRNDGAVPATLASLIDSVPANTSWVEDSLFLNDEPVGRPDGGASPLAAGIPISSANRTPPLPAAGMGVIDPGEQAVVRFDLRVDMGTPPGTIISNQALVGSDELPTLPTDGDGNPATGPEPTVVVVGGGQQLAITKEVTVVGGGPALAGSELEYTVRVRNVGSAPAEDVMITDDLDLPVAGQLAYVLGTATLNGATTGITAAGPLITADYSTPYGPLPAGATAELRFRATLDAGLAMGTAVVNVGTVTWDDPPRTASASASIDVGGTPGVGVLSGAVWHDADFDDDQGGAELAQVGWVVELQRNGQPMQSVTTDGDGAWRMIGLAPNDISGDAYAIYFRAPDAGAATASLGRTVSGFTDGLQQITGVVVASGSNLQGLNLPIDPNGVVYDAIRRSPVAGATLELVNVATGTAVPGSCFDDPLQQGQRTGSSGYYKFDVNFSDPACPSGGTYRIDTTVPAAGYTPGASQIIPSASDATTPLSVPSCPGSADDAIPATGLFCEVQASELPPPPSVPARSSGTRYHLDFVLDASQSPGSSQAFNNHLALDPVVAGDIAIIKTTPAVEVSRGDLVPYEITLRNAIATDVLGLSIRDLFPAGFRYVEGSARLDGMPREPVRTGRELVWDAVDLPGSGQVDLALLLAVGAGVSEGEYVNRAQAFGGGGGPAISGEASATVRVVPEPTFACTDVLGKVFDDIDRDGVQDSGERGLPGVRLVTTKGLQASTDAHGRFHITCAVVPNEDRGSNFVLKLDDRTLPSGYRMSTRQVQVKRATRGKALRFRFGASVDRVVGLDLADAAFEPEETDLLPHWRPRLGLLVDELAKAPATLRLSYIADLETRDLVERRLAAVEETIGDAWKERSDEVLPMEREVFWRRGGPASRGGPAAPAAALWRGLSAPFRAPALDERPVGEPAERQLPVEAPLTPWTHDPERLRAELGDRLEERPVLERTAETVKLTDVVPPIRFASGAADIPPGFVERLRAALDDMQHLENVRLHLVGHSDDQPLSPRLAAIYGDNEGLSRERAGEVAEFLQRALDLAPESVSFSWRADAEPVASNASEQGRARNRRVEVEVWYDEVAAEPAVEEFVVSQDFKRVKVCRLETVCRMRFLEGHERRTRIRNLVPPLTVNGSVDVPPSFVGQVRQALGNLRDERNVTVKFVGFTDDVALRGREARIYGDHVALSKAQARRVALAVEDALDLPSKAVDSDGRGSARPLASNDTERGRALNRRIEVEFWHDDPLQELPDEPQVCPDADGTELRTRVYDPAWGRIPPLPVADGEIPLPEGYTEQLQRALDEVAERPNARLRFVGYTANERLDRRTALVYGDDIGLSAARARRAMEQVQERLGLPAERVEHEGRGYVHARDVVNGGFIQGDSSHVEVEVVYDERAVLDDYEGIEITPITRELRPQDPLALNLMRITVDGEPLDDPGRSSADVQRCTDVALERADLRLRFDEADSRRRLSITSHPGTVAVGEAPEGGPAVGVGATVDGAAAAPGAVAASGAVRFRMDSNYASFLERAEVRILEQGASVQSEPIAIVPIGPEGVAEWRPDASLAASPKRALDYVLRVYDAEGRFDETAPQRLWVVRGGSAAAAAAPSGPDPLLAGQGESEPLLRNIPLGDLGTVRVEGSDVPPDHSVWLAGRPVPVDASGRFTADVVLPKGLHTVEVAVLDPEGNGELFLRDLQMERNDWFYVGIADLTVSATRTGAARDELQGDDAPYEHDSIADGRLAFFLRGEFGEDWRLTAHADTREGPVDELFTNFLDKSPEALFRRLDTDYYYPTFGDDGTVEETAPTLGKFYAKLEKGDSHAMWGNFKIAYQDNELALVERGLYGANVRFESEASTAFGERRVVVDGFAADPGTIPSREDFRGTGGSLYFLRHQDLLTGSDRVRVELRDKDSGLVTGVVHLTPGVDYDIDYFQGRILLGEPVTATVEDELLVRTDGLDGHEAWLVVQYEYAPGFDEIDALAAGGEGQLWVTDHVKVGVTANRNEQDGGDSSLYGGHLTLRKSSESWLKLQASRSEGLVASSLLSNDGGFEFFDGSGAGLGDRGDALAYRADLSAGVGDFLADRGGRLSLYYQRLEAGYSAPGLSALRDTEQYGGTFEMPVNRRIGVRGKADRLVEDRGLEINAQEVDIDFLWTERLRLSGGVRHELRDDDSPVVATTQEEGARTDAVVETAYALNDRFRSYAFGQMTLHRTRDREQNRRAGVGGAYRVNDRIEVDGEVSYGDSGPATRIGTSYQQSESTHRYLSYTLDNERGVNGRHARRGNLVSGARTRLSDSSSVYQEDRYQHSDGSDGLSRAMGVDYAPDDRWTFGASWELGTLLDNRSNAETRRRAGGGRVGYRYGDLSVSGGIEYRFDETEQSDGSWTDRTTWLFRNRFRYQLSPDWRALGKFNHSMSDSSRGEFFDGGFTEVVVGSGFRPVEHDRLDALFKYTYFYNVPTTDQVSTNGSAAQFLQKSHILALDVTYDLTRSFSIGGKYAYRLAQVALEREDPDFFDNSAHLGILRGDLRLGRHWEGSGEVRTLYLPDLDERRSGALLILYRYLGDNLKLGAGYNFSDFSEDLTDLSYDHHGFFFNLVGSM